MLLNLQRAVKNKDITFLLWESRRYSSYITVTEHTSTLKKTEKKTDEEDTYKIPEKTNLFKVRFIHDFFFLVYFV